MSISLRYIVVLCFMLLTMCGVTVAQDNTSTIPPIAYVQDYSLNVFDPANGTIQNIAPASADPFLFYRPFWLDGTRLAYLMPDAPPAITSTLYITDLQSEPTALLSEAFAIPFAPTWLTDGRILYATYSGERVEMTAELNAYTIAPEAGSEPTLLGTFEVIEGCGGGTGNPAESEYFLETSLGGYREVFTLTPYGLVHDGQCVGAAITLTTLDTGAAIPLADGNLVKGVVSPDGSRVLGISNGLLTIVNLADMSVNTIATSTSPDQYIWQDENHIIYSNMTMNGDLLEPYNETEIELIRAAQGGFLPEIMPRFQANISSIDLSTGEETPLYSADAYAIGRMAVRGDRLLFSEIENADRWVQAMADGIITVENSFSQWDDIVYTRIYALNLQSGEITLLLEDAQQMAVAP